MNNVINETNGLRELFEKIPREYNPEFLTNLENQIQSSKTLMQEEAVKALLSDITTSLKKGEYLLDNTKKYINSGCSNLIFSIFNSPYFPTMKIESCYFERLPVDNVLKEKYESNVTPVLLKDASKGFDARSVVALFPENHIDNQQLHNDRIFYFIDKFAHRFHTATHKMLTHVVDSDFFDELIGASPEQIQEACVYWIWLHEYFHRQGHLPIPKYLHMKSSKPLAGLEEMRVDLCAILACVEDKNFSREKALFVSKFIIAERLLRYAVEGMPKPNYDAIASQLLFNYLIEEKAIYIKNQKLCINDSLLESIKGLLEKIYHIEASIEFEDEKTVQQSLLNFIKQYTNYNEKEQDFLHSQYFQYVKDLLNV